jgi:hypothetical protein
MEEKDLQEFITQTLKIGIQQELLVRRASRAYDGTVKPVSKKYPPSYGNRNTTGNLFKNINVQWIQPEGQDPKIQVSFPNAPEWYWVNYGRRGKKQSSALKYPPLDVIKNWTKLKGILPFTDENGEIMDEDTRAFLLQRSIGLYGVYGIDFINETLKKTEKKLQIQIGDWASEYFRNAIREGIIMTTSIQRQ